MVAQRDSKLQTTPDCLATFSSCSQPLSSSSNPRPQSSSRRRSRSPLSSCRTRRRSRSPQSKDLAGSRRSRREYAESKSVSHDNDRNRSRSRSPETERKSRRLSSRHDCHRRDRPGSRRSSSRDRSDRNSHRESRRSKEARECSDNSYTQRSDDLYRPPRSCGYAPSDTPLRRGVQETDRYRPSYQDTPSFSSSHPTKGLVADDNPRSKGFQAIDHTRPDPTKEILASRISAVQEELVIRILLARSFGNRLPSEHLSTSTPNDMTGSTTFSCENDGNIIKSQHQHQHPDSDTQLSKRSRSGLFSIHDEEMYDDNFATPRPSSSDSGSIAKAPSSLLNNSRSLPTNKQQRTETPATDKDRPPMVDAATSRRLFGGIIKPRRPSVPAIDRSSSPIVKLENESKLALRLRANGATSRSSPSLTGSLEVIAPAHRSMLFSKSNRLSLPNFTLSSTNTDTNVQPSPLTSTPSSIDMTGQPKLETAWRRMVRESNERWAQ